MNPNKSGVKLKQVQDATYLRLVGNGRMVVVVVIIVPRSSIPYKPKLSVGFRLMVTGSRKLQDRPSVEAIISAQSSPYPFEP